MTAPTRRLILMRHAKSAWKDQGLTDHERPLNPRGRRDAPAIADALRERGWIPDVVVSSTANRTRQTWNRMEGAFDGDVPTLYLDAFYLAGIGALQDAARSWEDSWQTVLCLGHNPGWEHAVSVLSGVPTSMTTANAALLERPGAPWAEALEASWSLVEFLQPNAL